MERPSEAPAREPIPGFVNPVYCALDTSNLGKADQIVEQVSPHVGGIKLGLEFFCAHGPAGVEAIAQWGLPLFLDLKLQDIPNTVAGALTSLARLAPRYVTLHVSGGRDMLCRAVEAANEGAARHRVTPPVLLGVTVLTSLDDGDLQSLGVMAPAQTQVLRLADLAHECGLGGIVCSPLEIGTVRERYPAPFQLAVPGLRPSGSDHGDQKRVLTPPDAAKAGADVLVIGRPITSADDPARAAAAIEDSIAASMGSAAGLSGQSEDGTAG